MELDLELVNAIIILGQAGWDRTRILKLIGPRIPSDKPYLTNPNLITACVILKDAEWPRENIAHLLGIGHTTVSNIWHRYEVV